MTLSGQLFHLRALEPSDLDDFYRWENDAELWQYGSTIAPYSRQQVREYIDTYDADIFTSRQLRLMIVDNATDRPVGAVDLTDFDPINRHAQLCIFVEPGNQRRGAAACAIRLVEVYCAERLGMHQLWAIVSADNTPCRSLFTSLGYKIAGCLPSWLRSRQAYRDAYIYQRFI